MAADDARSAVLDAARSAFAARGYARTTVKGIASAAGVAPAVLSRYYRSKGELFAAAMRLPTDPSTAVPILLAPGVEGLGDRLVQFTLDTLAHPEARADLVALLRAGTSAAQATRSLQEYLDAVVIDRVVRAIGVPDARMRSSLITSYLLGVATTRYIIRMEPLASASDEQVVRMVGPVIQGLLDPRVPVPGSKSAPRPQARP